MYNQKDISDEEINRYKDFNGLIKAKEEIIRKNSIKQVVILGILLISGLSLIYYFSVENVPETKGAGENQIEVINEVQESKKPTQLPAKDFERIEDVPLVEPNEPISRNEESEMDEIPLKKDSNDGEIFTNKDVKNPTNDFIDAHPEQGFQMLYEYLENEMRYPSAAIEEGIEGTLIAEFTIAKDGKIENIKVIKGLSAEIDKEAIRLISEMPPWIPATFGNENIASKQTIPLTFHIEMTQIKKK